MTQETNPEADLNAAFEAAGVKTETTPEPVQEKPTIEEGESIPSKSVSEPVVDWQKRYLDLQKSHDKVGSENKSIKEQMGSIKTTLASLRSTMAQAESIDDIHAALAQAEKATGGLTFEGLDGRTASILTAPLNERFQSLENQLLDMKSKLETQDKIKQLETKYPILKDHGDLVRQTLEPLLLKAAQTDDGDDLILATLEKGVELSRLLDQQVAKEKEIEAGRQTPDGVTRVRVSKPTDNEPTQEEIDAAFVADIFRVGSEKGTTFS